MLPWMSRRSRAVTGRSSTRARRRGAPPGPSAACVRRTRRAPPAAPARRRRRRASRRASRSPRSRPPAGCARSSARTPPGRRRRDRTRSGRGRRRAAARPPRGGARARRAPARRRLGRAGRARACRAGRGAPAGAEPAAGPGASPARRRTGSRPRAPSGRRSHGARRPPPPPARARAARAPPSPPARALSDEVLHVAEEVRPRARELPVRGARDTPLENREALAQVERLADHRRRRLGMRRPEVVDRRAVLVDVAGDRAEAERAREAARAAVERLDLERDDADERVDVLDVRAVEVREEDERAVGGVVGRDGRVGRPAGDERPVREMDERQVAQRPLDHAPQQPGDQPRQPRPGPPPARDGTEHRQRRGGHVARTYQSGTADPVSLRTVPPGSAGLPLLRPVARFKAVGALQVNGSDAIASSGELPLLGRARELAELTAAFEDARAGRGGLVLIHGEPGIGKTRLARTLGEHARSAGAQVALARGWEGGGAPSYWHWLQVIRALAAERDDARLAKDLGAGARWVAQIAPEIGERVGATAAGDASESEQARFALFDAVAVFLRRVAGDAPLVVLLDDLHTADLPSLLLLAFLARAIGDCPVLVVSTHHDAGPSRGPEVEGVFGELSRFGRRIEIGGLEPDDLRRLIVHRSGEQPPDDLVRRLAAVTEGNPFFSDEVVRLLVAHGRVEPGSRLPLPDGVRDAIRRRLQPLSPPAREALEVAAVARRGFRVATLERAAGVPRAELLERLDEALALHLLDEAPSQAGSFRFAHGLIRETLYNDLSAIRRARLHGAVGEALERAGTGPGGAGLLELAHHFIEAAPAGDERRALDYADRAGHEALRALAYEQAADLFDAALRALDLTGEPDEKRRGELVLARGQAQMHAGEDAARACLLEAFELGRTLGDGDLLGRAALSLGGFGLPPGIVDDKLVAVLEEALAAVDPADSALRARLLVRLAVAIYWCNEPDRREALVSEAVAIARRLGDPATLAFVLDQGRIATSGPETLERELAWAHELFALSEVIGDHEAMVRARVWHIDLLLELDDLPAADMAIATLDRIATDVRDPRARSYIPLHRARRALMEGRAEEAEQLIDEGVKLAWSLQDSTVPILAGAQLFSLRRAQGRLGELEDAVRQFADSLPAMPAWRCALAVLYLDDGRELEARRELEHLAGRGFEDFPRDNVWMVSMSLLAELCEGLQDGERAAAVEKLLAPFASRNVVSPEGIFGGPVTRYLALCAATREDWETARTYMARARDAAKRLSLGPTLALLDLDEARILARRGGPGDAEAAAALLARAREQSTTLGVPEIGDKVKRVEAMVGAADGDGRAVAPAPEPATGARATAAAATALLRREGDVWRVEYDGRARFVKDAKGLRHLALLLANPGVEFHAVDIVGAAEGTTAAPGARATAAGDGDVEARRAGDGDAGAMLDAQAKREYRSRLEDLRAEIEEAEEFNDPERAARAREEMAFIARELSR